VSRNRGLRAELGTFDFTLLVLGAVIGADVYVVAAMGASALGPAQLVAWFAAGLLAGLIALTFVQCAAIDSDVGGSYSYARTAFGPFVGFITGWALYIGEWVALPVFPLAFVNYFSVLVPDLSPPVVILIKVALVGSITSINLLGVRQGARLNDVLTLAKLLPLSILICLASSLRSFIRRRSVITSSRSPLSAGADSAAPFCRSSGPTLDLSSPSCLPVKCASRRVRCRAD
jgi:Amino acid transporters